jgi:FkbM family methyltransferase
VIRPRIISYSQNREDLILMGFFDAKEQGFYVDVGAESPNDLSVTKNFYDRGWRGINIEPIKRYYSALTKLRPRDINLNIGISDKIGTLKFREYEGSGYSTFSTDIQKQHLQDHEKLVKKYNDYVVKVETLESIFSREKVESIQFMKIDVEGYEYKVLAGNDWIKYRPEVICIEANHIVLDWREILNTNHYSLVFFDGLNEYYTDDYTDRASKFSYIESIIYSEPIVNYMLLEDFKEYDELVAWLENKSKLIESENTKLKTDINKAMNDSMNAMNESILLRKSLEDISSLPKHAKKIIKNKLVQLDQRIQLKLSKKNNYEPQTLNIKDKNDMDYYLAKIKKYDTDNYAGYNNIRDLVILKYYKKIRAIFIKFFRVIKSIILGDKK